MRTVRGLASYADATRVLARLEGVPEHDIEPLVMVGRCRLPLSNPSLKRLEPSA